jgi:hypothetical protein
VKQIRYQVSATWHGGGYISSPIKPLLTPAEASHMLNELVNSPTPPSLITVETWDGGRDLLRYGPDEPIYGIGFGAHQRGFQQLELFPDANPT